MYGTALRDGRIARNFAAGHTKGGIIVKIDRASVSFGRVSGDFCAGNRDVGAGHVYHAAVIRSGRIPTNGTADKIDRSAVFGEEHAALLCLVARNFAAVHIYGSALAVKTIKVYGSADDFAVIAAYFAAVDIKHTVAVVERYGTAAATTGDLAAGDFSPEEIEGTPVKIDAHAAPAFGCALDCTGAAAVAYNQAGGRFVLLADGYLIYTVALILLTSEAKIKCLPRRHRKILADNGILRQIDICRIVAVVLNIVRTVPALINDLCVIGMIPYGYIAAAYAVLMYKGPVSIEGMILTGRYNGCFLCLCTAVPFGKPAVKPVAGPFGHGQSAVGTVTLNRFALLSVDECTAVRIKGNCRFGGGIAKPALVSAVGIYRIHPRLKTGKIGIFAYEFIYRSR